MKRLLPLFLLLGLATLSAAEKQTFVLVHGAWAGGWEHKALAEALETNGHQVHRVTLTGHGERSHLRSPEVDLSTHIQDVVNFITWEDLHDVVLVGHSYGGMVITGVVDRIPDRFKHVIYLDAFLPEDGESAYTSMGEAGQARRFPSTDGFIALGGDMSDAPVPHIVPQSEKTFTEPVHLTQQTAARAIPTTYILTVDPGKRPEEDMFFRYYERAKARGWVTEVMEGTHVVHIDQTAATAKRLEASLTAPATASAPDPNFSIFLCLGQSNMEGFPGIPEADKAYANDRFKILAAVDFPELGREAGHWYTATPPLCRPNSGVSPADFFGRTLVEHLPANQRVGIVSVAVAGSKLEVFDPTRVEAYAAAAPDWMQGMIAAYQGHPYNRLIELAKQAQQTGVIRGILLHQGESNTGDATWPAQVQALYQRLLSGLDLNAADVPLLVGELVNADQGGACASMNEIIATVPALIPTAHVISSAGAPSRPDHLHFTPDGYRLLGSRYAETMLSLLPNQTRD